MTAAGKGPGMVGRVSLEHGHPVVIVQRWGPGAGDPALDAVLRPGGGPRFGPRNVLVRRPDDSLVVRPFRGLRRLPPDASVVRPGLTRNGREKRPPLARDTVDKLGDLRRQLAGYARNAAGDPEELEAFASLAETVERALREVARRANASG
jgi:acetyl esterase